MASFNPSSDSYEKEIYIAQLAVQRASILTQRVFEEKVNGKYSKDDASPVTIGDLGAQALINHAIKFNFHEDAIMAEEDASFLRKNSQLTDLLWSRVKDSKLDNLEVEAALGGPINTAQDMLDAIDNGNSLGGRKGRIWVLDPIDGTKGFLRRGQYAICLALVVDGQVKLGVLGCPNLKSIDIGSAGVDFSSNEVKMKEKGILLSAIEGRGAISRALGTGALETSKPIHMRTVNDISKAILCESVESAHSSHEHQGKIAVALGLSEPSIKMDSQAKYASLALGMGDIYLRLMVNSNYQEKIWDHAAGDIIVREAGAKVTDNLGQRLDFGQGRTLVRNKGIIVSSQELHEKVLSAVKKVLAQK